MSREERRGGLRIDPSDLVLEIISIVIAIVLATAAGQYVQHLRDASRTHDALERIRVELQANRSELASVMPLHLRLASAFDRLMLSSPGRIVRFDAFARTFAGSAPRGIHPFAGDDTAWELARSSGALDDVDYPTRLRLEHAYAELSDLRLVNETTLRAVEIAPTSDEPNFYYTAVVLHLDFNDMKASEARLAEKFDAALAALEASGIR